MPERDAILSTLKRFYQGRRPISLAAAATSALLRRSTGHGEPANLPAFDG